MSKINTGGPAFPTATLAQKTEGGMTLRDYFAAKALQGLCAGFSSQDWGWPRDDEPEGYEVAADHAYMMADAMLRARDGKA